MYEQGFYFTTHNDYYLKGEYISDSQWKIPSTLLSRPLFKYIFIVMVYFYCSHFYCPLNEHIHNQYQIRNIFIFYTRLNRSSKSKEYLPHLLQLLDFTEFVSPSQVKSVICQQREYWGVTGLTNLSAVKSISNKTSPIGSVRPKVWI